MLDAVKAAAKSVAAVLPYPRSFLALLLTGFMLVTIPLVGALAYSAWNTERLAGLSRSAVFNASQAARASRSLVDRIAAIERVAQQMAVLNDPELAVDYARVHRSFKQLAEEIAQLPLDDSQAAALGRTIEQEQSLYDLLTEQPRRKLDTKVVSARMDGLIESAREVLAINNNIVDREVHRLRGSAEQVQRGLIVLVFFSTAVALTIALALTRYIARPISEIDGAIRQLGGADFSKPIAVRGPEDLRYLGRRLVELNELVRDAAQSHELAAQAKGLRLTIDAQSATLEADPQKLRSIVDNLISNAVKFTPPGGTISVKARALAGEAVIEVMDSGPGVAPEERESIFNLFFRGRTKADTGVKGSGLGLAIARELVEAHGGEIAVVAGGAGGHFRVTLPRRRDKRAYSG